MMDMPTAGNDVLLIPRIIHRIWPGEDSIPADQEALAASWAHHHPHWEMKLWRPGDLPPLRNQEIFDGASDYALRSDIARYEILLRFGGIYVDCDFECLRCFEDLLLGIEAFIGTEDGRYLTNALIGATPGHPFMKSLVEAIPASVAANPRAKPNVVTGPHLVTSVFTADPALRDRVLVCDAPMFYPYLFNERYRRHEEFADSYAVHHWAGGWIGHELEQTPPRYRVIVAGEWGSPTPTAAVLSAFAGLFAAEDPVELVLAVPHEPGPDDLAQAQAVLRALAIDPLRCAPLALESFSECLTKRYDIAVVPSGSADHLLTDVAAAVGALHRLRTAIERDGRPALAAVRGRTVLAGDLPQLGRQLAEFRSMEASAPAAPTRAPGVAGRAHRATYVGNDRLLVSTNWGGKLFMSASDLSLTPEVVHDGNYDDPFTRFLERILRPGDVVFDIGANVGLFTVLMGQLVGPNGRVVAYEAGPENIALLRDNIAMNYYSDWVEIIGKAAAARPGVLNFHQTTRFQGNGSLLPHDAAYRDTYSVDEERIVSVEAEPLDVHAGRFAAIHLVKIDVEGGEERVLDGMEGLLASGVVHRICLELLRHRLADDWEPICARLCRMHTAGWTLSLIGATGEPTPVDLDQVIGHGTFSQLLLTCPGL